MNIQYRQIWRFLAFFVTALLFSTGEAWAYRVEDVPNVHVADRTRFVSNPDGILSYGAVAHIDSRLRELRDSTTAEAVVVAVDDIEGYDADMFATKLFEKWGLGKKDRDNGLLVLVVKNQHKVVIRTGRGLEGPLPDVACGRIIRGVMAPDFREEDYDRGVAEAVEMMSAVIKDPANAGDVLSGLADVDRTGGLSAGDFSLDELLRFMGGCGVLMALGLLVALMWTVRSTRGRTMTERWTKLSTLRTVGLFLSFVGLGIPLIGFIPTALYMRRMRRSHGPCQNCGGKMHRLDEETDNQYLTKAQDTEERINSIDYDVWLCDNCGTTDVIPFVNHSSSYTQCQSCGAKACTLARDQVVVRPTERREGEGVKTFVCMNCHQRHQLRYRIAKLAAPVVVVGGFGGGRGGGPMGGGFGGGMTSGGGASGGW